MGRTLAVLMSGEPVESISWEEEWRQSSGRRGMPQCPPHPFRVHSTQPEKETAFETSAFPLPLQLSPSTMREVAAPAPKPGDGEQQPMGGFSAA